MGRCALIRGRSDRRGGCPLTFEAAIKSVHQVALAGRHDLCRVGQGKWAAGRRGRSVLYALRTASAFKCHLCSLHTTLCCTSPVTPPPPPPQTLRACKHRVVAGGRGPGLEECKHQQHQGVGNHGAHGAVAGQALMGWGGEQVSEDAQKRLETKGKRGMADGCATAAQASTCAAAGSRGPACVPAHPLCTLNTRQAKGMPTATLNWVTAMRPWWGHRAAAASPTQPPSSPPAAVPAWRR